MASDTHRLALITGASRGLGRSTALALAQDGVDVIITYNTQLDSARNVAQEVEGIGRKAAVIRLDTTDVAAFPAFVDSLRELLKTNWSRENFDFLVNNAGIGLAAPVTQTSEDMSTS